MQVPEGGIGEEYMPSKWLSEHIPRYNFNYIKALLSAPHHIVSISFLGKRLTFRK